MQRGEDRDEFIFMRWCLVDFSIFVEAIMNLCFGSSEEGGGGVKVNVL